MIKSQKGQAMVELALTLPILILILFGIIDFGRIFHVYLTLENAGREAARIASLGGTDTEIAQMAKQAAPSLNGNNITVTASPSKSYRTTGTYVTVTLTYPISFSIPLLSSFLPDPVMIHSKTVMRVE
ncbi:TadE/TadG family type IV pilus assembly protein [Schinkia sp. CFF1]